MDFVAVLKELVPFFLERKIRYAVIGGVGSPATECLVPPWIWTSSWTARLKKHSSVSRNRSATEPSIAPRAIPTTSIRTRPGAGSTWSTFARPRAACCSTEPGLSWGRGGLRVPVPRPEHLIAMKVVAMKNDPRRTYQDMADIQFLLQLPEVDRDSVRAQFEKHGMGERYRELENP